MAKCQFRAPASQPPNVSQFGAGVPCQGQQQNVSPLRANAGYALKIRSPLPTMMTIATALTQWVTRTTQWWRLTTSDSVGASSSIAPSVAGGPCPIYAYTRLY